MPIGEFGGVPRLPGDGSPAFSTGLYWFYEMGQAALNPSRALADITKLYFKNPLNPLSHTTFGKSIAAGAEMFERSTRRYGKPDWRIDSTLGRRRTRAGPYLDRSGSGRSAICCISSASLSMRRAVRSPSS